MLVMSCLSLLLTRFSTLFFNSNVIVGSMGRIKFRGGYSRVYHAIW